MPMTTRIITPLGKEIDATVGDCRSGTWVDGLRTSINADGAFSLAITADCLVQEMKTW